MRHAPSPVPSRLRWRPPQPCGHGEYGVIGKVAEAHKVMMLARIEDDPNDDAAPFGVVEGVEHNRVRERVGA